MARSTTRVPVTPRIVLRTTASTPLESWKGASLRGGSESPLYSSNMDEEFEDDKRAFDAGTGREEPVTVEETKAFNGEGIVVSDDIQEEGSILGTSGNKRGDKGAVEVELAKSTAAEAESEAVDGN